MKEYLVFFFHDPKKLLIIDTLGLEVIKSVQTGISMEIDEDGYIEDYGLLLDESTQQISVWHQDQIQN